jgi:hypothetical protein
MMNGKTDLNIKQTQEAAKYIHHTWSVLRRTEEYLLQLLIDPKLPYRSEEKRILYVSRRENIKQVW